MRWSEMDLERAEWVIPKERSKNAADHAVDLAATAVSLLKSLPREHALVFTTTGTTLLSNHAKDRQRLLAAMRHLAAALGFGSAAGPNPA